MNDTGLALWGGSLRWIWQKNTQKEAQDLIQKCQQAGGHALRYRGHQAPFSENFLSARPELMALQEQVRRQFDPTSLFNRNRFGVTHVS
jgi:FAD/FMN-containing dehydrogenase